MTDDANPCARAIGALAEIFLASARFAAGFEAFERGAIRLGHGCMADAPGLASEALGCDLLSAKPDSLRTHDVRERALAAEIGDASYSKAASLLARSGSQVRSATVMDRLRMAGLLRSEDGGRAARSLYVDGIVPEAEEACDETCAQTRGAYFSTQECPEGAPGKLEAKAVVGYSGEEVRAGRARRRGCVRHALAGKPEEIRSQGAAAIGERCGLASVKQVHLGADGEHWRRDGERRFPPAKTTPPTLTRSMRTGR